MPRARFLLLLILLSAAGRCAPAAGSELEEQRARLYQTYAAQLDTLAAECRAQQLDDAATELASWLPKRSTDQLTLLAISGEPSGQGARADGPADAWRRQWQALREQQAQSLMALARRALAENQLSLVYQLLTETVRENPGHKAARRMLGYVWFRDAWHTPFAVKQLQAGKVWSEKFGWLPGGHLPRYVQGERYYQGRWMPAEAESKLRRNLKRGWRIDSEHYLLTTNAGLEEGVRLSRQLEALYANWQQAFIGYLASAGDLSGRLEGRAPRREVRQHHVIYYRTRAEYQAALRPLQPKIDITLGIYLGETRTAYFFAGAEQEPGTVYHEAAHQLFHEAPLVAPAVGREANFWAIEGIACYMETLTPLEQGAYYTLGGPNAGRVPAARHRLLSDDFYVPLAELVALGMQRLQADPRIQPLYSQSAALADFFMHDAGGRYREPFVNYLTAIYRGRADRHTLAELTGVDYETLDRQYRAFLGRGAEVPGAANAAVR